MKSCLVNGIRQNHIEIQNRGIAYGDGLFTTAKVLNGSIEYLSAHIERLIFGCKKLGITPPSKQELIKQLTSVAKDYSLAVLKVIITANSGGRGYARAKCNEHDLIIMIHDYPHHYDALANVGIKLGLSKQQMGINPMLAGLKHLNRLEQVLLKEELSIRAEDDLLVANINNEIIEATSANLFVLLKGKWHTPDVSQSGVNGIMRQAILQRFPDTIIKPLILDDIIQAQAMFICNCIMGIMPVSIFNDLALSLTPVNNIQKCMNKDDNKHD